MRMGSREEGIPDAFAPPEAKLHETMRTDLTWIFIRLLYRALSKPNIWGLDCHSTQGSVACAWVPEKKESQTPSLLQRQNYMKQQDCAT